MAFGIIRAKKLKSMGAVSRSARHTFRERPTPNADPAQTGRNASVGARGASEVLAALDKALPAKRRKDAVLAVEYLVTASPEAFRRHGEAGWLDDHGRTLGKDGKPIKGRSYFNDAISYLQELHGAENVLSSTLHLDETTPHLVVYVVPKTADGRLSCRDFLGGPEKLRALQDGFHQKCGEKRGLERGVRGSKAKHESISAFYADLNRAGEAPKLKPKDYAAAAVGIKTKAWEAAEATTRANAVRASREPRKRKASRSRARALEKQEAAIQARSEALDVKAGKVSRTEVELSSKLKSIEKRERELAEGERAIRAVEVENETLRRRLDLPEKQAAPRERRSIERGPKAPGD